MAVWHPFRQHHQRGVADWRQDLSAPVERREAVGAKHALRAEVERLDAEVQAVQSVTGRHADPWRVQALEQQADRQNELRFRAWRRQHDAG